MGIPGLFAANNMLSNFESLTYTFRKRNFMFIFRIEWKDAEKPNCDPMLKQQSIVW